MKFLTLERGQLGALIGEVVVDLIEASQVMGQTIKVKSLKQLIDMGDEAAEIAWTLAQRALAKGYATRRFADVKPLAPIPQLRRNIFCLGKNYREHAKEIFGQVDKGNKIPHKPIFFTKSTTAVTATLLPGDIIATGTPAGVGMGFNPPRYLRSGDEITIEITGVGRLVNSIA